jgi:plasmid stabilization system protein ParE
MASIHTTAKEDTNDIWRYIARDNPKAADAFLDAMEEASELLSTIPKVVQSSCTKLLMI